VGAISAVPQSFLQATILDYPGPYGYVSRVTTKSLRSTVLPREFTCCGRIPAPSLPDYWDYAVSIVAFIWSLTL
jgi:hypothetical protein